MKAGDQRLLEILLKEFMMEKFGTDDPSKIFAADLGVELGQFVAFSKKEVVAK